MGELTVLDRLDALSRAVEAGEGVLTPEVAERAATVESRAGHRLRLSSEHTVAAFAGSTGSGKSSLLNALVGEPVAAVDVLRPTTSEALAVVRGQEGSGPLLDWLDVRRRHQLPPDAGAMRTTLDEDGLILLDLPDHDSVVTAHRLEAERLVALVDLMVWVVDPQKYADAAVHERYLRGLTAHREVVLVVLNQVDRLTAPERAACHRDLERLLDDDGLAGVPVLDVSARTGEGVDGLRQALDEAAARRVASRVRVEADVIGTAQHIQEQCGSPVPSGRGPRTELVDALSAAAGVPLVVEAVRGARILHAHRATGWPATRWLSRFRADPLRRLHLGTGAGARGSQRADSGEDGSELVRTSVPPPGPAEMARARAAVRSYTDAATAGVPDPWVLAARDRTPSGEDGRLADALDRAVGGTRVVSSHRRVWWAVVGFVQWVLVTAMVAGLAWLGVLYGLDALRMPVPEPPMWGEVPVPTGLAVGGAVAGLLLAGISRIAARVGANRQARRATAHLKESVGEVADRLVVQPVEAVLQRLRECRAAADQAASPPQRRRGKDVPAARRTAVAPRHERGRR